MKKKIKYYWNYYFSLIMANTRFEAGFRVFLMGVIVFYFANLISILIQILTL